MTNTYKIDSSQKNLIISLVFLFIFADVLCENFIGVIYNKQTQLEEFFLFIGFTLLQIFFAPIQAGLSDLYGRKKSLIVSLIFSLISLILISFFTKKIHFFYLLIFATLFKGVIGNTLPISLAVIADSPNKNYRLYFAFSTAAYALAYLTLIFISDFTTTNVLNNFLIAFFLIVIIICTKLFKYTKQKNNQNPKEKKTTSLPNSIPVILKNESNLIFKDLKHVPTIQALAAFFFWETSLYSILVSQIDFQINKATHIAEWTMLGYLLGVLFLICFQKTNDSRIIKFGYYVSWLSLIPFFLMYKFIQNDIPLLRICYFCHAVGNALLSPALLSILAKERKAHERGRLYGLTDSIDTLGYLFAALFIIVSNIFNLDLIYTISYSFITFTISWAFYNRFQNVTEQ